MARGIPARSYAVGANEAFSLLAQNYNMPDAFREKNGWPVERKEGEWDHSDIRDVAYLYTFEVYLNFVSLGGLN